MTQSWSSTFGGTIDEVRISDIARSESWIKFEYMNISSADNQISFAAQEQRTTTPPRPNPLGGYTGSAGLALQFTGIARYPDFVGLPPSGFVYSWDFGDGAKGTGPTPSHIYSTPGNYTITFSVTDPYNNSRSATTTVNILASGSTEKPRTDFQMNGSNLLAGTLYGKLSWAEMAASGAWGANADWEQGKASSWHIELQRYGGDLVVGGAVKGDTAAIEAGLKAFEWGFNHQATDGSFAGTADPFHSTAIFVEAVSHSLLILKQTPYAKQYKTQIDSYVSKVNKAAAWMASPTVWETGIRNNSPYTHRRYIVADALALTAKIAGGNETYMSLARTQINDGLALQQADGVNPELGGYDSSYQTLGIAYATRWVTYFPSDVVTSPVKAMIGKGLAWEETKILATGEVDLTGSSRTTDETGPSGTAKTMDWRRAVEAFDVWFWKTGSSKWLLNAQKIAQFYYKQY